LLLFSWWCVYVRVFVCDVISMHWSRASIHIRVNCYAKRNGKERDDCLLALSFSSLFAYVYIWAAPRPFWREQRTTSKNERAEKDGEKKKKKRKGNTNEQRTLAYTHRSGTLFWLLLIIGHHHKNRTHVHIHRDNHTTIAVISMKWWRWSANRVHMMVKFYFIYIRELFWINQWMKFLGQLTFHQRLGRWWVHLINFITYSFPRNGN
jgi:hypothetical protein